MNLINRLSGVFSSLINLLVPVALVAGLVDLLVGDTTFDRDNLTGTLVILTILVVADRLGGLFGPNRGVVAR